MKNHSDTNIPSTIPYSSKSVLLIAGGGTLGTYTGQELLRLGCTVDVICLEDKLSDHERLKFYKENADLDFLTGFLQNKHYNGIVNFIHYPDIEEYKPVHELLTAHTDHLIFLSSYRVYADEQHPVTENAPRLLDVSTDSEYLAQETYSVPKAQAENFLWKEAGGRNFTIVRPVISSSSRRFDVVTRGGRFLLNARESGETVYLPRTSRHLTAGLDWAGNSGKLIAHLLFKEETFGQAYTISSAQNLTWEQVADLYTELMGIHFEWVEDDFYISHYQITGDALWILLYDRFFDRTIDNSKVLQATGLTAEDFTPFAEGIRTELENTIKESIDSKYQRKL